VGLSSDRASWRVRKTTPPPPASRPLWPEATRRCRSNSWKRGPFSPSRRPPGNTPPSPSRTDGSPPSPLPCPPSSLTPHCRPLAVAWLGADGVAAFIVGRHRPIKRAFRGAGFVPMLQLAGPGIQMERVDAAFVARSERGDVDQFFVRVDGNTQETERGGNQKS